MQPDWSPDGASVAFASDRDGGSSIHVMSVDGPAARRVTDGQDDSLPRWSPDGRSLCLARGAAIWIARIDRSVSLRRLAPAYSCAWSADATDVIFDRDDHGAREVYSIPAAGDAAYACPRAVTRMAVPP